MSNLLVVVLVNITSTGRNGVRGVVVGAQLQHKWDYVAHVWITFMVSRSHPSP